MRSLRDLQSGFAAALLEPNAGRAAPGIRADGISPALRLGFYRNNVLENYRKALAATYPAIERLVGIGCFLHLAYEYARRHASRSGDVGMHGERFADFLERHAVGRALPYLADVARLEWAIEESFYEADRGALPLERLAQVPAEQVSALRFHLAPSCRLLRSRYPVHRIWQIGQAEYAGDEQVNLDAGAVQLLVRRARYAVTLDPLPSGEFAMLDALRAGYGFGEAFAYALTPDAGLDAGAFLQRHIASGVLCDFVLPAEAHAFPCEQSFRRV
jgi:hypothetical protein